MWLFWTTVMLWIANMCHHAKFHQNWSNVCKDIVKVSIFYYLGMKTAICTFFRCFWVKDRRKWKLSAVSSLYECTDLELKLQWLFCIVATKFIKNQWNNSWDIAFDNFLNGSIHHLEFFLNVTFLNNCYALDS